MKGLFIPEITAEMFRNGRLESIEALMAEGEIYDIEYSPWIPVSERLPEEKEWIGTKRFGTTMSDEVYITFETTDGKRFCDHCRLHNGKLNPVKQSEIDVISKGAKMIAWRPLPEPCEAESEDKE